MAPPPNLNRPAAGIPYFTPAHLHSPGTPKHLSATTPTLFTPLRIRDALLRNRIAVAPMCQYSAAHTGPQTGALTDWHVATLGHYAMKGAALVFIEATGVQARGRISPNCPGIWADGAQVEAVRRVADFVRSQGALCGIQLAHAGRKGSTAVPWVAGAMKEGRLKRAGVDIGGWPTDVVGPSGGDEQAWDGPFEEATSKYWAPRALTREEIGEMVRDWASAAERSVRAGVDVIEIHAAHGYLLNQFMSPVTNRRTDEYGGSFENRIRLLVEIIKAIRAVIPAGMPLFLRISATEWLEGTAVAEKTGSWDVEESIKLAKLLPGLGVDLLDVSTGGNHPAQKVDMFNSKDYQVKIADRIRDAVRAEGADGQLLIGAVGRITEAEQARDLIQEEAEDARDLTDAKGDKQPKADIVLVARQFMREPEWVMRVAAQLGVEVWWANQFLRTSFPLQKTGSKI